MVAPPRTAPAQTLTGDESAWLHAFLHEPVREPTAALERAAERHRELFGRD